MGIKGNRNHSILLSGFLSGERLQQQLDHTHREMYHELTHARYYSSDALQYSMRPLKDELANVFELEENLMERHIYPKQQKHKHEHDLFLCHFNTLCNFYPGKTELHTAAQYPQWRHLYWLCEWLRNHIQWSDHCFYSYLRQKIDSPAYALFIADAQCGTKKQHSNPDTVPLMNFNAEHVILKPKNL